MNIQSLPRTVDYAGQTLYHARDVAERLGYDDPSGAVRQHCRKPLGIAQEGASGIIIGAAYPRSPDSEVVVSLSDVVLLALRSPSVEAEAFHYVDELEEGVAHEEAPTFGSLFKSGGDA